jgi:hypothetical protein
MRLEVEPSSGEVGSMSSLTEVGQGDDAESVEDQINRIMAARKMLPNARYFAFTATPKNKTLEIFGEAFSADGQTKTPAVWQLRTLRCHKLFRMALEKQKPDPASTISQPCRPQPQ